MVFVAYENNHCAMWINIRGNLFSVKKLLKFIAACKI
jgi:hypothetical protein